MPFRSAIVLVFVILMAASAPLRADIMTENSKWLAVTEP